MPTTPPRSAGVRQCQAAVSHGGCDRSPVRQLRHCAAIPDTVPTLWEPATPCADVPRTALATVLPTPRTSSSTQPSASMGATLERCTDLDRGETPSAEPSALRQLKHGGRYFLQQPPHRPQESSGRRRDPREATELLRATVPPDAIPHSVLSIVRIHCTPPIRGEDDDFRDLPVHVLRPSLCL